MELPFYRLLSVHMTLVHTIESAFYRSPSVHNACTYVPWAPHFVVYHLYILVTLVHTMDIVYNPYTRDAHTYIPSLTASMGAHSSSLQSNVSILKTCSEKPRVLICDSKYESISVITFYTKQDSR